MNLRAFGGGQKVWSKLYNVWIHYTTNYLTSIWMEVDIFEMEDKQVIGPLFLIHVLKK